MSDAKLTSLAFRVHRMDAMVAFYSEAFGVRFREVKTGPFTSQFGELAGVTLKFVPIRDDTDFAGFAVHQPGFEVTGGVQRVVDLALKHGGRIQDAIAVDGDLESVAIRDPDGNTIELYSRRAAREDEPLAP